MSSSNGNRSNNYKQYKENKREQQRNQLNNDKNVEKVRGEASRSECTSCTRDIRIPGLSLTCDYISEATERLLVTTLSSEDAPWAASQWTPSGYKIKRRVQHYGYVFDYRSADVLRRDEFGAADSIIGGSSSTASDADGDIADGDIADGGNNAPCWACPPLPAMNPALWDELGSSNEDDVSEDVVSEYDSHGRARSKASREGKRDAVCELSNEEVERWISKCVERERGWEALAGVIERTRRFDCSGTSRRGYPDINQLTVNEYVPGQGIGSHIDTLTAFDDGLLILSLHGGIVMEFRKAATAAAPSAAHPNGTKKLLYLPPRSLLLLSDEARYHWEHKIVSRSTDTVDGVVMPRKLRISLTLRTALATSPRRDIKAPPLARFQSWIFPPAWAQPCIPFNPINPVVNPNNPINPAVNNENINNNAHLHTPSTERKHVHAIYDAIALQWHHTRGKRGVLWPGATSFLSGLQKGSIVADVGCGDGKYFSAILGSDSYVLGLDISLNLLKTIAAKDYSNHTNDNNHNNDNNNKKGKNGNKGNNSNKGNKSWNGPQAKQLPPHKLHFYQQPSVAVADCIHIPLRDKSCDAAICIAVMHHLSTPQRRLRCLRELARIVKVGGRINVQAWALEQEETSRRKFNGTDVFVPFNANPKYLDAKLLLDQDTNNVDEMQNNSKSNPCSSNNNNKNKNNNNHVIDSSCTPAQLYSQAYEGIATYDETKKLVVFQRYCHLYTKGELEQLVSQISELELLESSYESGNHVVLLQRVL